jgi:hypothetical protein
MTPDWRFDLSPEADPLPLPGGSSFPSSPPDCNGTTPRPAGGKGKGKSAGRFATINAFADFALGDLSRAEIATWLLLWRDTKPNGTARTSLDDLARRGGMNRQTVFRAVRRLQKRGLVVAVLRGGLNRGPTAYRVRPLPKARAP